MKKKFNAYHHDCRSKWPIKKSIAVVILKFKNFVFKVAIFEKQQQNKSDF